MNLTIISVPYAAGRLEEGMGRGPSRYLTAGADRRLRELGHHVDILTVRPELEEAHDEPVAVARIAATTGVAVAQTISAKRFPLVLAGNCNSCLGTLAGLQSEAANGGPRTGIVWLDSHGDLNTPESSPVGFFDGMGLAIATGRCLPQVREQAGLSGAVPEGSVLHLGSRDLDPPEREYLEGSPMLWLPAEQMHGESSSEALAATLRALRARVADVYLHIDIDVLAGEFAPGIDFPAPGGLTPAELERTVRQVAQELTVRAAALTAYNPDNERDDLTLRSGLSLMEVISDAV